MPVVITTTTGTLLVHISSLVLSLPMDSTYHYYNTHISTTTHDISNAIESDTSVVITITTGTLLIHTNNLVFITTYRFYLLLL